MLKFQLIFCFFWAINVLSAQQDTLLINGQKAALFIPKIPLYKAKIDKQYKLYNALGQEILTSPDEPFHDIRLNYGNQSEFYRIRCGRKYGIINTEGRLILALEYENIKDYRDNLHQTDWNTEEKKPFFEVTRNKKIGLVDTSGKVFIPPYYDYISRKNDYNFSRGFWLVTQDNKEGIFDSLGKELVPCIYDRIHSFNGFGKPNLAIVKKGHNLGAINAQGQEVIPCRYERLGFEGIYGVAAICENDERIITEGEFRGNYCKKSLWGFVDTLGKQLCEFKPYTSLSSLVEGFAVARHDEIGKDEKGQNKWMHKIGFVDSTGRAITNFQYWGASNFSKGLAKVWYEDKLVRFIDTTGKEVIVTKFQYVEDFKEGFAVVSNGTKYGFIDTKGKIVVPLQYDHVQSFKQGKARVYVKDKQVKYKTDNPIHKGVDWVELKPKQGIVDTTGKEITDLKYCVIWNFSEGLARVCSEDVNDYIRFIDTTGKEVIVTDFKNVEDFKEGFAVVCDGGKCGFMNTQGVIAIPLKYNEAKSFNNGKAWVRLGSNSFFINKKGEKILKD